MQRPLAAVESAACVPDSRCMAFVSITRLRIRSLWFLPQFFLQTQRTISQVKNAGGFLGGSLLPDRRLTFWTMTLWRDQQDMRAYIVSGPHLKAMPRLLEWCDQASIVHWTQADDVPPSWSTADLRMRTEGRPSKVRNPAAGHLDLGFDAPRTIRGSAIVPTS